MATTRKPGRSGGDTGIGGAAPIVPLLHQQIMLLLRADCLAGAVETALKSGDQATAARMTAKLIQTITEARELAEKVRNQ